MTGYERTMYERDLPQIREALQEISESLKTISIILSDPGDEIEHIYENDAINTSSTVFPINYYNKRRDEDKDIHNIDDMD